MQFNKLRLTGFKSFVDPTDLIIADGLTGVVGPNGCGKSNLLEALRWVMGETRAKAMRGGGMEDVIFAGAASRPARNFAEVSLGIDNSERLAPSGFNESDQLEIVRRITRDAGSAYKVNGKDTRARDVQMLFADASTGAHSPALVRQGQISELINAKPKNRRRVLEDAAGIGGLYQRRHEAELKLASTEANLLRVEDVIEQLATQLAQLARQAKQAARYRAIGLDLRRAEGMLLYRRWREADEARQEAAAALRDRTTQAARAETEARRAGSAREEAETALPPRREEEAVAAAILQRLSVETDLIADEDRRATETIDLLSRRIEQLGHDMAREAGLNRDAGDTLARLEKEAAELLAASEGHEDRLADAAEEARDAAAILQTQEADLEMRTEAVARLAARHQSAERGLSECRKTLARIEAEADRARSAGQDAGRALAEAEAERSAAVTARGNAAGAADAAEAALGAAEAAHAEAQDREADARAARSEAEGEATALRAEVAALARLLERDTAEEGQVLDRLEVAPGFEKALGAALADDLRAPEVAAEGPTGWTELPGYAEVPPLPDGVAALGDHVRVPGVLARRMDQIGLVEAAEGPRLQAALRPGQRLVSPEGDLWRWDGYRAWAADMPSAAALRLEQGNRLGALRRELAALESRCAECRATHESRASHLAERSEADGAARRARREADRALTEAMRLESRAEAASGLARSRLETARLARDRFEAETGTARTALAEAERIQAALDDLDVARAGVEDVKITVEAARMTMIARRSAHDELERGGAARAGRLGEIETERSRWRARLDTAESRAAELEARKEASQVELTDAARRPEAIAAKRAELARATETAEARRAAARDALAGAEAALRAAIAAEREAERSAGEAREARAAGQARAEAAEEAVEAAAARIAEDQGATPEALLERLDVDPDAMQPADRIEAELGRLKRQRDALGSVNLRAEEDARAVEEEHALLAGEKADLDEAVRTLRGGIAALNREGRERLLTAFEQVNANFGLLFTHLFGGGEANLVMVESDDPLDAGLEILCQPPGKKLSTLSLLSGGEQTLTALALIFAVFLANPAPICVLDEVDAPLDDANVTRFCDMLDEMCRRTDTRFLIITHHAVTMARMDRLFGVTMQEQGVSQLVSVDLKRAETLVA